MLLQEDLQDLRSRNQEDSVDDSTLAGDDSRLPNLSPGNSDSDKDPEHNDIPRLWAPGQTPRGIKLRQERQILEQQKLLGVDKVVSSNPGALIGASKYASAPHQSPQAGAFSPQAQHNSAMPVQPAQYQHVILAERTLGAPSATSNSAIEAPPQVSANPTNSGQLPSTINAQDGLAYQTEGVEARILNGVAGLSSRLSPPLTAQNLRQHHNLAAVSSHSGRAADNLRTSLSPQKFKVKVPKYVLDQKDRLQQDLKLSTETIQVQKELIVKYESRENEQRRLLLTMTKERDGLRQQLIERINTDASRASKDSQRQRRELEEARKRAELLSGKVRDMQAALAEADAQLTTYEFQAQQTEVERKESAALLADMTRALQQKHDALTAMSQQCQRAGEDAEARVAELRSRLDASASEKQALQQELADERLQLQQCRDRITELSNLVSVLQTPSSGPHTQSPSLAPSANSTASVGRRSSGGQGDAGQPLKPREAARAVEKVKASPPADSSIAGKISNFIRWT